MFVGISCGEYTRTGLEYGWPGGPVSETLVGCQLLGKAPDMLGPGGGNPVRLDGADGSAPGGCPYRMTVVGDDPVAMLDVLRGDDDTCGHQDRHLPVRHNSLIVKMRKWSCEQAFETAVDRKTFKDVPCYCCLFTWVAQPKGGGDSGWTGKVLARSTTPRVLRHST